MKKRVLFLIGYMISQSFLHAQTEIWGVTNGDGVSNFGFIFKTDISGNNFSIQKKFTSELEGKSPQLLMQSTDGMLYGVTSAGGANGTGVLYQYDPINNVFSKKWDFIDSLGATPAGTLTEGNDGMLYGVTRYGGAKGKGVIYMFNPSTSVYTKKMDFDTSKTSIENPSVSLVKAADGTFYGAGNYWLPSGDLTGKMYNYDPATSKFTKKAWLPVAPNYDMLRTSNNQLYFGVQPYTYVKSVINYNPSTDISNFFYIFGSSFGPRVSSSLVQTSDTILYGMLFDGNLSAKYPHIIYKLNLKDTVLQNKIALDTVANIKSNSTNLVFASDKKLFGLLFDYSVSLLSENKAVLFQYDLVTGKYTEKQNFNLTDDSTNYGNTGSLTLVNKKVTGISKKDNAVTKIAAYPNPTTGLITLTLDQQKQDVSVKVINILGKIAVPVTKIENNTFTIDITNQPTGIYFLEVTENQKLYRVKVVKQ
ncbi:MAG: choice-of-anchor tandem repeat GloVer-containing protein [Bacteroidia bacterium]